MCSRNELLVDHQVQSIPKIKPIDVGSIKKEAEDDEYFVVPGIVESVKVENDLVKKEIENHLLSKV